MNYLYPKKNQYLLSLIEKLKEEYKTNLKIIEERDSN